MLGRRMHSAASTNHFSLIDQSGHLASSCLCRLRYAPFQMKLLCTGLDLLYSWTWFYLQTPPQNLQPGRNFLGSWSAASAGEFQEYSWVLRYQPSAGYSLHHLLQPPWHLQILEVSLGHRRIEYSGLALLRQNLLLPRCRNCFCWCLLRCHGTTCHYCFLTPC